MSYKRCCIPGCSFTAGSENALHDFPNPSKDLHRFMIWVNSIGGDILKLSNNFIFQNRRVCRMHFEEKYHCRLNRLSNIAVPTMNMPCLNANTTVETPLLHEQHLLNVPSVSTEHRSAYLTKAGPLKETQNMPMITLSEVEMSKQRDYLNDKVNIGPKSSQPNILDHDYCSQNIEEDKLLDTNAADDTEAVPCDGRPDDDHDEVEGQVDEDINTEITDEENVEVLQYAAEESGAGADPLCEEPEEEEEEKPDVDELNTQMEKLFAENMARVSRVEDLEQCCHLCLSREGSLAPLLGSGLEEMLMDLFSLEVRAGDVPAQACGDCAARVSSAHSLQRTVRAATRHLARLLQGTMDSTVEDGVELNSATAETKEPSLEPVTADNQEVTMEMTEEYKSNIETEVQEYSPEPLNTEEQDVLMEDVQDTVQAADKLSDDEYSLPDLPFEFDNKSREKHVCSLCEESFTNLTFLLKHKREKHGVEERHVCRFCGKIVKYRIDKHERLHFDSNQVRKKHKCEMCGAEFGILGHWRRHVRCMHNGQRLPVCHACVRAFDTRELYYDHLKEVHGDKNPYKCSLCPRVYKDPEVFNRHMKRHYKNQIKTIRPPPVASTDPVAQIIAAVSQDIHSDSQNKDQECRNNNYKCEMCGAGFAQKLYWKRHIKRKHNGQRLPVCRECVCAFDTRELYFDHLKEVHGDTTPFRCSMCPRGFQEKLKLDRHIILHNKSIIKSVPVETETSDAVAQIIAAVSTDIDPDPQNNEQVIRFKQRHKCEMCGTEFRVKGCWLRHINKKHNGQRRPACRECGRDFDTRELLFEHLKQHGGRKPPYTCTLCPRVYTERVRFDSHMMRHYGIRFKRSEAKPGVASAQTVAAVSKNKKGGSQNKSVSRKKTAQLATPTFSAVIKIYACARCKSTFISSYALNRHKLHCRTMECEVCDSKFENLECLVEHYKSVHELEAVRNPRAVPAPGGKTLIQIQPDQVPKHLIRKVMEAQKLSKLKEGNKAGGDKSAPPLPEGRVASWYRDQAQEIMKDL
ncbi:PR domain zinc finger protein 15 isoform X3 [Plutella xylostella]|uniref:PR domain zinc finger protein 15 isoform X3 n=1 Tax=Plutella xylostella TaxID=51655 RepID=UPI0020329BB1|nr:PR domain zinc finger protein 15 isoform X3 [Plutella xylostella]